MKQLSTIVFLLTSVGLSGLAGMKLLHQHQAAGGSSTAIHREAMDAVIATPLATHEVVTPALVEPDQQEDPEGASELSARHGGFEIVVRRVEVGSVPIRDHAGPLESQSKNCFIIELELTNRTSRAQSYYTWRWDSGMFSLGKPASLVDDEGRSFNQMKLGFGHRPLNSCENELRLSPGETAIDVLLFEVPEESIGTISLTLPGDNVFQDGHRTISIPGAMFQADLKDSVARH